MSTIPQEQQHDLIQQLSLEQGWSRWLPLQGCWRGATFPTTSGLYRVRCVLPFEHHIYALVLYIGQSSNLRTRLGMFADVFRADMPFRTPHVAGPGLWALLHRARLEHKEITLEASVMALGDDVAKPLRLGYEALAIGMYRQKHGMSPLFNYSRMPRGYVLSSYNNGPEKRYRGVPSPRCEKSHLPSLAPVGSLWSAGAPTSQNWCGHAWSEWVAALSMTLPKECVGLYRLRSTEQCDTTLLYVGSGKLRDRLKTYQKQAAILCSWAVTPPCEQGYQEYIDDALAAHVVATNTVPTWQFEKESY